MPCKNGNRKNIDNAKAYYAKEKELDRTCPYRALWKELASRAPSTFQEWTEAEIVFFTVNILSYEVYNGGLLQYFENTSGDDYALAVEGLKTLTAQNTLNIILEAKIIIFGTSLVPSSQTERWKVIQSKNVESELDNLDDEFYCDEDDLQAKLETYAVQSGLVNVL